MFTVCEADGTRHLLKNQHDWMLRLFSLTGVCPNNQRLIKEGRAAVPADGDVLHLVRKSVACDFSDAVESRNISALKLLIENGLSKHLPVSNPSVAETMQSVLHPFSVEVSISNQNFPWIEVAASGLDITQFIRSSSTLATMVIIERSRGWTRRIVKSARVGAEDLAQIVDLSPENEDLALAKP